jgi:hypothetical protein
VKVASEIPKVNEITHLKLTKNGWIPLKEPKSLISAMLLSVPLMILAGGLSSFIIMLTAGLSLKEFGLSGDSFTFKINLGVMFSIFLLVIFHELLHLLFIPNFVKSAKTAIGLTFWGGFVVSEEEISRTRYIFITLAPYVI